MSCDRQSLNSSETKNLSHPPHSSRPPDISRAIFRSLAADSDHDSFRPKQWHQGSPPGVAGRTMSTTHLPQPLSAGSASDPHVSNNPSPISAAASTGQDTPHNGEKRTRRGVRHLSEQQLEKKRKNDREAQRAIRERTKNQIEQLEMKVKELESGQAFQQMQELKRERDALQAENERIKASLASIQALIQPLLEKANSDMLTYPHIKNERELSAARNLTSVRSSNLIQDPARRSVAGSYTGSILDSPHSAEWFPQSEASSQPWSPASAPPDRIRFQSQDRTLPYYNLPKNPQKSQDGQSRTVQVAGHSSRDVDTSHSLPTSPGPSTRNRLRSAVGSAMEPISNLLNPTEPYTGRVQNQTASQKVQRPPHLHLPANTLPTCAFDSILYDFLTECQKRIAAGLAPDELLGQPYPDFSALLHPDRASSSGTSLSSLLIELLKGFSNVTRWPDKIGLVYHAYYLLRWCVSPTPENFDLVPEYMRPTSVQATVPHPIWVTLIPWPECRNRLCYEHPRITLDNFFMPFTLSLCANWPYNDDPFACLCRVPEKRDENSAGGSEELRISPAFKEHVDKLENWTLGPEFAEMFPILADTVRIKYS